MLAGERGDLEVQLEMAAGGGLLPAVDGGVAVDMNLEEGVTACSPTPDLFENCIWIN